MGSREVILGRIRAALGEPTPPRTQPESAEDSGAWAFGAPVTLAGDVIDVFDERVADYKATVVRVAPADVPAAVVAGLGRATSVVLPAGVPASWRDAIAAAGIEVRDDDPPLDRRELDLIDAVLTAAAVGVAETGTIVLDHGPDQGRRALTLVPDLHVCVVRADQVVSGVPEAVARLASALGEGAPLTWISGPSATSDIELSRVEGVHGPRTLHVILAVEPG